MSSPFEVFFEVSASRINTARLQHLATLQLDLDGKRVLEVGAGVGRLTGFFEERGCTVVSTDGRPENVEEIRNQFPHRRAEVLDLETTADFSYLGEFDIVFCYGTLYHLQHPEAALKAMAQVCRGMILLETCVTPGDDLEIHLEAEDLNNPNQAYSGMGCRPTRPWIMAMLKQCFGYAYVTQHQPCHHDFDLNWESPYPKKLHRSVFVGSKQAIANSTLSATLPSQQLFVPELQSQWVDEILHSPNPAEWVELLEPKAVVVLAEAIAAFRPLQHYPGWHFNIDFHSEDPSIHLRRIIWQYFHSRHLEASIHFPWYNHAKLRLYLGNDVSSQLFIAGYYDPNEFHFLSQVLAPGMTFLDLGANEGLYSIFASTLVTETGLVFAFEPSPREFQRLQDNIALNNMVNVKPLQLALSNLAQSQPLKIADAEHSGQNTLGNFAYEGISCSHVETVLVRRLDDLVADLQIERVDVIKIDVEGAEALVFDGARQVLKRFHPLVLFESVDAALRHQDSGAPELLQLLRELGYEIFCLSELTGAPLKTDRASLPDGNAIAAHPSRTWTGLDPENQAKMIQAELILTQEILESTLEELAQSQSHMAHVSRLNEQLNQQLSQQLNQQLNQQLEQSQELNTRLKLTHQQVENIQADLEQSQRNEKHQKVVLETMENRIAAMESSKFWQIRNQWLKLRRRLGLPGEE